MSSQLQMNAFFFSITICSAEGHFFLSFASFLPFFLCLENHLEFLCLFYILLCATVLPPGLASLDSLCDPMM
jgi:hypothetical protein